MYKYSVFVLFFLFSLKGFSGFDQAEKAQLISYNEWFVLQKTGAVSGKKYMFLACFDGERNMTSPSLKQYPSRSICHANKMIFYSTDSAKSNEMKKRMAEVDAEFFCVTAFITGNQTFIYSIANQDDCK